MNASSILLLLILAFPRRFQTYGVHTDVESGVLILTNGNGDCCTWGMERVIRYAKNNKMKIVKVPWSNFKEGWTSGFAFDDGDGKDRYVKSGREYLEGLPSGTDIYMIGHSWGADSSYRLVNAYDGLNVNFRLLALLDTVGPGPWRGKHVSRLIPSKVDYFFNRWQTNELFPNDFSKSGKFSNCAAKTCDQSEHSDHKNADGSEVRVSCGAHEVTCVGWTPGGCSPDGWKCWKGSNGTKKKKVSHEGIVDDAFIETQLITIIDHLQPRCGGSARDVAVGANGDVWIVDNDQIPQANAFGGMIRRHTGGTTWDWVVPHVRAVRIAVAPDGTVWYVDGKGDVYSMSGNTVVKRGGTARSVAVGANGDVWIVDNEQIPESNWAGGMIRRNTGGTSWNDVRADIRAVEIAVAPDGSLWMVNGVGEVHALLKSEGLLKLVGGSARDIAVGSKGDIWIVDSGAIAESNADGGMIRRYTGGSSWGDLRSQVRAIRIAVAPDGTVWTVNGKGVVTTPLRPGADVACLPGPTPAPRPRPTPFPPRPAPRPRPTPSPPTFERFNFWVINNCQWTSIRLAIRYRDTSGDWVSNCWWNLDAGNVQYLKRNGQRLETTNKEWYFYAERTDGSGVWRGTDSDDITSSCDGRSLEMRRRDYVDGDGDLYLRLTCSNESKPTPAPPRPRPTPSPPPPTCASDGSRAQECGAGSSQPRFCCDPHTKCSDKRCVVCAPNGDRSQECGAGSSNPERCCDDDTICENKRCVKCAKLGKKAQECGSSTSHPDKCCDSSATCDSGRCSEDLIDNDSEADDDYFSPDDVLYYKKNNHVCRSYSAGKGKEGVDYVKYGSMTLDRCRELCSFDYYDCEGFEWRSGDKGYCEIWTERIDYAEEAIPSNGRLDCWSRRRFGSAPSPTLAPNDSDFDVDYDVFPGKACGFDGAGIEGTDFDKYYGKSLDWCKEECYRINSAVANYWDYCYGFDYDSDKDRCRIFLQCPNSWKSKSSVTCWLLCGPSYTAVSPNRVPGGDCAASGKKSQACGGPSDKPAVCCKPERGCDEKRCN